MRLTVFEATNDRLKERYVSATSEGLEAVEAAHHRSFPPAIAHWQGTGRAAYRVVEPALPVDEAHDFVERYGEIMRSAGWRTIVDLPRRYTDVPD